MKTPNTSPFGKGAPQVQLANPADAPTDGPLSIEQYDLLQKLGHGGMGVVWLARDRQLDRQVAIKVLRPGLPQSSSIRLLREARAAAKLSHPNVVSIYHVLEQQGQVCIVMELLGRSLLDELSSSGRLPWPQATQAIRDAAAGLAAAHSAGLVHRDIKPSNLLRDPQGRVKLADFGLADSNADAGLTADGVVMGTPGYMSPEQSRGDEVSPRSDVYGIGCTFYHLLTGRPPFREGDPLPAMSNRSLSPFPDPRQYVHDLPDEVCHVIATACRSDPQLRYPDAAGMLSELELFLDGSKLERRAPGAGTKARIFVYSPGDVAEERVAATSLIRRLSDEYASRLRIEPIFREPDLVPSVDRLGNLLPRPCDCEIVVCILWARLGSWRSAHAGDNDSSGNGGESEFEEAVEARKAKGQPDFLVYHKTTTPVLNLDHEQALLKRLEQKKALDAFIQKWFFNGDDGGLKAAFHTFGGTADFEVALEEHLRKLIRQRLLPPDPSQPTPLDKPSWTAGSPFRGLDVFEFEHAPVFFGRTQAVGDVINLLRQNAANGRSFVLVVGVSGGGKSSLVRAGVLPVLTQPGVIEGVGLWRRAVCRPGDSASGPLRALAASLLSPEALPELGSDGTTPDQLAALLRLTPAATSALVKGGLSQAASALVREQNGVRQPNARLVLVVDQLEELFTLAGITAQDRQAFVAALASLACSGRVFVIATLRGDFYHRCFELPDMMALQEAPGLYALPLPAPADIGQMIRQPARAAGLSFEEDAATRTSLDQVLCEGAIASPESLPLLEFALEELYQRRAPAGLLTYEAYRQLGGVEGALTHRAEAVFASLPAIVRETLPRIMRALVSVGEGEAIARQQALMAAVATSPQANALVEAFITARLFTADRAEGGQAVVRVTHEALVRTWDRAKKWLEQDKELLMVRGRISAAATLWEKADRRADLLLGEGRPLGEAVALAAALGDDLDDRVRRFVRLSVARASRRRLFKRAAMASMAALTMIAGIAAIYAQVERVRANFAAMVAETRGIRQREAEVTALAERRRLTDSYVGEGWSRVAGGDPAVGLLYFSRAIETSAGDARAEADARTCFGTTLATVPSLIDLPSDPPTARDDTSKRPKLRIDGKSVEIIGPATDNRRGELQSDATVNLAILSPDGQWIVTAGNEPGAIVWGAQSRRPMVRLNQSSPVSFAAFGPDGRQIITAGRDKAAQLWDSISGKPIAPPLKHRDAVLYAAFSPDGTRIVTCSQDQTAMVWDTSTGKATTPPLRHTAAVVTAAFSPDGKRIATGCKDATAQIWDSATGTWVLSCSHKTGVNSLMFSPDGRRLTTCSEDHTSRVWDAFTGRAITPLLRFPLRYANVVGAFEFWQGQHWTGAAAFDPSIRMSGVDDLPGVITGIRHQDNIISLAFSPDGKRVVTGSDDRTARVWRAQDGQPLAPPLNHGGVVRTVAFSPDGLTVLTSSDDSTAQLWSAATGAPIAPPLAHEDVVYSASFSADGRRVVTASNDRTACVWDAATGRRIASLPHSTGVWCAALSPDGSRVATGCDNGAVSVWDLATGKVLTPLMHKDRIFSIAFSPDGSRVVTASRDHTARVWSPTEGVEITKTLLGHGDAVRTASFSPDGNKIVTGSYDGTARVWDASTGEPITPPMRHERPLRAASFSPDSARIVTASDDGSARVWDASSGLALTPPLRHAGAVWAVAFSPDGRRVGSSGKDGTARIWNIVPDLRPGADLKALAELLADQRVNSAGQLEYLSAEQWEADRERIQQNCPKQLGSFSDARRLASRPAAAPTSPSTESSQVASPAAASSFWWDNVTEPRGPFVWEQIDYQNWRLTEPTGKIKQFRVVSFGDPKLGKGLMLRSLQDGAIEIWAPELIAGNRACYRRSDDDNKWRDIAPIHPGRPPAVLPTQP